jgi:hypothetical protein
VKRDNTVEQYQYDKDGNQIALNTTSGNTEYRYKAAMYSHKSESKIPRSILKVTHKEIY